MKELKQKRMTTIINLVLGFTLVLAGVLNNVPWCIDTGSTLVAMSIYGFWCLNGVHGNE